MKLLPNFIVAETYQDFFEATALDPRPILEKHLDEGGIIVVEIGNKFFNTRILDGGKRLRITEAVIFGTAKWHEIPVSKGPRAIARVKTQITGRDGRVHKFEAYYLAYKLTPTDLRDELVAALPNV